jgi:carboxyl-terminal processing protease
MDTQNTADSQNNMPADFKQQSQQQASVSSLGTSKPSTLPEPPAVRSKTSTSKKFQKVVLLIILVVLSIAAGYYFGARGFDIRVKRDPPEIEVSNKIPPNQDINFSLFWDVWTLLTSEHIERPFDTQQMVYGAIKGMVESVEDPYTSFLPPEEHEAVNDSLNGTYEGIGAELDVRDGQLMVVAPLDGSPAKAAGIRSGDKIVKIEDELTIGIGLSEAVTKIRGEAGTISTLTIVREGIEEPFPVRIKRGKITVDSVTWEDKGDGVAYIRISRFGNDTNAQWDKTAAQVNVQMPEINAIVIDVRGNPGGYLLSPVHIAGDFMKNKIVALEENSMGDISELKTNRLGNFEGIPLVVLIDGGSASASEILAAALKLHADALLVGTQSFGKGTIQDARDFPDGSSVHITVAKWLTPDETWVHETGITPDEVVELSKEDIEQNNDIQLEKALELAKQY